LARANTLSQRLSPSLFFAARHPSPRDPRPRMYALPHACAPLFSGRDSPPGQSISHLAMRARTLKCSTDEKIREQNLQNPCCCSAAELRKTLASTSSGTRFLFAIDEKNHSHSRVTKPAQLSAEISCYYTIFANLYFPLLIL
jgi:hypothetical protein